MSHPDIWTQHWRKQIALLESAGLSRNFQELQGADFCSNDYLGIIKDGRAAERAIEKISGSEDKTKVGGSSGSRMISGHTHYHEQVELLMEDMFPGKKALLVNSGWHANSSLFRALCNRHAVILYDEYCHASIRDGIRLSDARSYHFRHNDAEALSRILERHKSAAVFVVTESVYSMQGTNANKKIRLLQREHEFFWITDDAHSFGLTSGTKSLLAAWPEVSLRIIPMGKAAGATGAFIVSRPDVIRYLQSTLRSLLYSTSLPVFNLVYLAEALQLLRDSDDKRAVLAENIQIFSDMMNPEWQEKIIGDPGVAITGISVPGNKEVIDTCNRLQNAGIAVRAIRHPTVPKGEERIRIVLHSFQQRHEIQLLTQLLKKELLLV